MNVEPRRLFSCPAAVVLAATLVAVSFAACADTGDGNEGTRAIDRQHSSAPGPETEPTPRTLEGGAVANGTPDGSRRLLPDLRILPIDELFVDTDADGRRILRFSTTVFNAGEGPLELAGRHDPDEGITIASQRIHLDNGSVVSREVGRFSYDGDHQHWHFEDFTVLEIWTHDRDRQLDELVASTGKGTFCAVDEVPEREDADPPAYLDCGAEVQGISGGWSDTYGADIQGQEIDISHLDDGRYAIRSIVDPDNLLRESNADNNARTVFVELRDNQLRVLPGGN